ncbi:uncharacterized protein B0P05DRAFT_182875 [Gilbertella persicaria]|uniref:uncharacterized protein n=1 Tax=Gilbertella persicaria TaxID=101096 RepID=UPI00221FDB44|nr:uncharacterized protein B0P05DRAFT_182875 [Gilbertella persicaria]KAI8070542.1 hypothetical protein B0P05DRAFT_182875 [Gilbertella persicaria]
MTKNVMLITNSRGRIVNLLNDDDSTKKEQIKVKRRYHCTEPGCQKSFTTSGHLARHHRIHTGEKNFHCLYPGCPSRFSRQDNMMQHYRTHMSSRSRNNHYHYHHLYQQQYQYQQYQQRLQRQQHKQQQIFNAQYGYYHSPSSETDYMRPNGRRGWSSFSSSSTSSSNSSHSLMTPESETGKPFYYSPPSPSSVGTQHMEKRIDWIHSYQKRTENPSPSSFYFSGFV